MVNVGLDIDTVIVIFLTVYHSILEIKLNITSSKYRLTAVGKGLHELQQFLICGNPVFFLFFLGGGIGRSGV